MNGLRLTDLCYG